MKLEPQNRIAVLLVDSKKDDYLLAKDAIGEMPETPYRLEWCSSFAEARKAVVSRVHDIYLVGYKVGKRTGFDLLEAVDAKRRLEPFIFFADVDDRLAEKRAISLGASDYLVKGSFDPEVLSRVLAYALGRKQAELERLDSLIELNQAKDEFISIASHQLRTPATGVKQYIGMLIDGMLGEMTDSQRAVLIKAYDSNERQLKIVTDLLKVARVDAGKVALQKTELDLNQLMLAVVQEQTETVKLKRQSIEYSPAASPCIVKIDRGNMRMVFENLIDNASKYSDIGKTIKVSLTKRRDSVVIKIEDEGVGVSELDQPKLFEKFTRIHNPLSAQSDGSGLGLYWVQKIIDLHQGSIKVKSELGQGTSFSVTLPRVI